MIELVVVLVLAGIIATMVAPSLTGYVQMNKRQRALDRIASDVAYARILAIRSGGRATLEVHSPERYSVGPAGGTASARKQVDLGSDYRGISVAMPTTNGRLEFDSRGLIRQGAGTITVSMRGRTDTLEITASGRVLRAY